MVKLIDNEEFRRISTEIFKLKSKLKATDYKAIKFAEGELSISEYAETKEQRRKWRSEINSLELQLKNLKMRG